MSDEIRPGWYKDPSEPETQRYWDGEGWIGDPLPVDAQPPSGPPQVGPPEKAPATPTPGAARPVEPWPPARPSWPGDTDERVPVANGFGAPGSPGQGPAGAPRPPGQGPAGAPAHRPLGAPASWYPTAAPPGWPPGLPAPRPHGLALAGIGGRVVARMIDILAVLVLAAVANAWFAYQWWQEIRPVMEATYQAWTEGRSTADIVVPGRAQTLELVMILLTMLAWFAYEVPAHANTGQTPGKRVMGIKVMRMESTEPLGFRRSVRRWNPLGLPTLLWACYGLGLVWQLLVCLPAVRHPLHQGLHDRAAQTVVVALPGPYSPTPRPPTGGTP